MEGSNTPQKKTTEKLKSGEYSWDILEQAGITNEADRMKVRSITFQQNGANGGSRIYEMYVRVPLTETGINNVNANANGNTQITKVIKAGRIVIVKNGKSFNAQGQIIN